MHICYMHVYTDTHKCAKHKLMSSNLVFHRPQNRVPGPLTIKQGPRSSNMEKRELIGEGNDFNSIEIESVER